MKKLFKSKPMLKYMLFGFIGIIAVMVFSSVDVHSLTNLFSAFTLTGGAVSLAFVAPAKIEFDGENLSEAEKALGQRIIDQTHKQVKKFFKENNMLSESEVKDQINARIADSKSIKELKDNMEGVLKSIKKFEDDAKPVNKKDIIIGKITEKNDEYNQFLNRKQGSFGLEIKSGEIESLYTDIANRDAFFTWHEGGVPGWIPFRNPRMQQILSRVYPSAFETVKYLDQTTVNRDAQNVALEGDITTTTKLTWSVLSMVLEKVKDYIDIPLQMMTNYPFVQQQIFDLIRTSLENTIDGDLLLGSTAYEALKSQNTGINIGGILPIASEFNAAGMPYIAGVTPIDTMEGGTGGVVNGTNYLNFFDYANILDLISAMAGQIEAAGQLNKWQPDVVICSPQMLRKIKALKDRVHNYLRNDVFVTDHLEVRPDGTVIVDNIKLTSHMLMPSNELLMFDSQMASVYYQPTIGLELSYENKDNFQKEVVTAKVFKILNLLVRNVDRRAFMKCTDVNTAIAAINNPLAS